MKTTLFAAGMILMLFIAGCSPQPEPKPLPAAQPAQPASPVLVQQRQATQPQAAVDTLTILEIQKAGIPVECDIQVTTSNGQTVMTKAWVLSNNIRTQSRVSGYNAEGIVAGGKTYVNLDPAMKSSLKTDCEWLALEPSSKGKTPPGTGSDPNDIKTMPKTHYTCRTSSFGQEKFQVSGKVCTLQDLIGGLNLPNIPLGGLQ